MSWGAIGSAVVGGAVSYASSQGSNDEGQTTSTETSSVPQWSPEQIPYLFGDTVTLPETPQYTAEGLNYAGAQSAGYNPAYGSQEPLSWEDFIASLEGISGSSSPDSPYYQDQAANAQQGGVRALLGYDQGAAPASFTNSPYGGTNVADPENLQGYTAPTTDGATPAAQAERRNDAYDTSLPMGLLEETPGNPATGGYGVNVNGGTISMESARHLVNQGLLNVRNDDMGIGVNDFARQARLYDANNGTSDSWAERARNRQLDSRADSFGQRVGG